MKRAEKQKRRYLVIIPTYNEGENVKQLMPEILKQHDAIDILFVDDNSPDGTAGLIKRAAKKNPRISLIERKKKLGLGTAYLAGFQYAVDHGYKYIFEMDADFSHNPAYLPRMIQRLNRDTDVIIGSRYIHGVSVAHWPISRLILSKGANLYASIIPGVPVKDLTAGFVGYKRRVLEAIDFSRIRSNGYAFQIEMKYRCHLRGFRLEEIPIIFTDRTKGESKISRKIIFEAVYRCVALRFSKKSCLRNQKDRS